MIDSVLELPKESEITIEEQRNFIASTEDDTTGHGTRIANIIEVGAPESILNVYRVVVSMEEFKVSNYLKALARAQEDNVDIINSSAGVHHPECNGECRISEATKRLEDDGIIIVAGAGNAIEDGKELYCPAKVRESIAVGVMEAYCQYSIKNQTSIPGFNPDVFPPGSYFAPHPENLTNKGPYCGKQGCTPMESCDGNRQEEIWEGNPTERYGSIDVFAPGTSLLTPDDEIPTMDIGSSFATAYVSSVLADILSEIHGERPLPDPREIKSAISRSSSIVKGTGRAKFDGKQIFQDLLQ